MLKNISYNIHKSLLIITFLWLYAGSYSVLAAQELMTTPPPSFINMNENNIIDPYNSLTPVMEHLHNIQNQKRGQMSILHIGDSHIQAGISIRVIRNHFQQTFGNAGRGLVAPLKLIGTNQPNDYTIQSHNAWAGNRCVLRNAPNTNGICGITATTIDTSYTLDIALKSKNIIDSFDKVVIFHENITDIKTDSIRGNFIRLSDNVCEINLDTCTSHLKLQQAHSYFPTNIYGFSLENSTPGVRYHSVGVNGAQYINYATQPFFIKQTAVLHPELIVISLGTNEAYGRTLNTETVYRQIDSLVTALQRENPNAKFLLATPIESLKKARKGFVVNPHVEMVRNTIIQYAYDRHLAFWDLFAVAGGQRSGMKWKSNNLMAKDGVHFTTAGYELQGELFFEAFMKLYNR